MDILAQIDREIGRLQQARALLKSSRSLSGSEASVRKRNLTPEGRKRISEAVKRRWANQKKNQANETSVGNWLAKGMVGS